MTSIERIRQPISGALKSEDLQRLQAEGWTLVALEWERESPAEEADKGARAEVPFGLQVATQEAALEENTEEKDTLVAMLELMIEEGPYWRIAEELNRRGHHTRRGGKWSPVSVFEMLPRLIEVAPRIFSTPEWHRRRQAPSKAR